MVPESRWHRVGVASVEYAAVLGFIALVLSAATLCHVWLARAALEKRYQALDAKIEQLHKDIAKVNHGAIGVGQRLRNVEQRLNVTADKQNEFALDHADSLPYSKAQRMLDEGMEIDQLLERCNMSKAELQLMQLLHKPEQLSPQ